MKKWANFLLLVLTIGGAVIGIIISALTNIDIRLGMIIGLIVGVVIAYQIPGLFAAISEARDREYKKIEKENRFLGFSAFIAHPTQLPANLGFLWMTSFLLLAIFYLKKITDFQMLFGFLPALLLFSLSGLNMIRRREYLSGRFPPYIINLGTEAIILGSLLVLLGGGLSIALIVSAFSR